MCALYGHKPPINFAEDLGTFQGLHERILPESVSPEADEGGDQGWKESPQSLSEAPRGAERRESVPQTETTEAVPTDQAEREKQEGFHAAQTTDSGPALR